MRKVSLFDLWYALSMKGAIVAMSEEYSDFRGAVNELKQAIREMSLFRFLLGAVNYLLW